VQANFLNEIYHHIYGATLGIAGSTISFSYIEYM
jgi:hypothetical protein